MKKIQLSVAPLALAALGVALFSTGHALGQDTPANPPETPTAEQQATELKTLFGDRPETHAMQTSRTPEQLEVFLAYTEMRIKGYKIVDINRFVNAYDKGKTDPRVIKEAANIGLAKAKEGDTGPLLMAHIVLQQRQIEQNDQIIALLQEIKAKK